MPSFACSKPTLPQPRSPWSPETPLTHNVRSNAFGRGACSMRDSDEQHDSPMMPVLTPPRLQGKELVERRQVRVQRRRARQKRKGSNDSASPTYVMVRKDGSSSDSSSAGHHALPTKTVKTVSSSAALRVCPTAGGKARALWKSIKSRCCYYLNHPVSILKLGLHTSVHALAAASFASGVTGTLLSLGLAPFIGPGVLLVGGGTILVGAAVIGGFHGFYRDFFLEKDLLPDNFSWLDVVSKGAAFKKFEINPLITKALPQ